MGKFVGVVGVAHVSSDNALKIYATPPATDAS